MQFRPHLLTDVDDVGLLMGLDGDERGSCERIVTVALTSLRLLMPDDLGPGPLSLNNE